jgi:hypothetical protein
VLRKCCAPAAPESAIAGEISVPDGEILTIYENHYSLVEADELKAAGSLDVALYVLVATTPLNRYFARFVPPVPRSVPPFTGEGG